MPPPMRRRDRHPASTRCRTERDTLPNKFDKGQPAGRSELGVSVNAHPGPPDLQSWRTAEASGRARTFPLSRSQPLWAAHLGPETPRLALDLAFLCTLADSLRKV